MKIFGNQLRAARGLVGLEQIELAEKADVAVNTIRLMEARGASEIGGREATKEKIVAALARLGVEFTNGGEPGVKLVRKRRRGR